MNRNAYYNGYYVRPLESYVKARTRMFLEVGAAMVAVFLIILLGLFL